MYRVRRYLSKIVSMIRVENAIGNGNRLCPESLIIEIAPAPEAVAKAMIVSIYFLVISD